MCDQFPWQNEGEDYTLLGHPYLFVGKLVGYKTSCLYNTVSTQRFFFFLEKTLLRRHVLELIAPSSGHMSALMQKSHMQV
jgi:hypothetical protein